MQCSVSSWIINEVRFPVFFSLRFGLHVYSLLRYDLSSDIYGSSCVLIYRSVQLTLSWGSETWVKLMGGHPAAGPSDLSFWRTAHQAGAPLLSCQQGKGSPGWAGEEEVTDK